MAVIPGKKIVKPGITGITRFYWILAFGNYFFNPVICNLGLELNSEKSRHASSQTTRHVSTHLVVVGMRRIGWPTADLIIRHDDDLQNVGREVSNVSCELLSRMVHHGSRYHQMIIDA